MGILPVPRDVHLEGNELTFFKSNVVVTFHCYPEVTGFGEQMWHEAESHAAVPAGEFFFFINVHVFKTVSD